MVHIALLRAVNLAGHNRVAMADLRALLSGLGLEEPRSLLASGNLVFGSEGKSPRQLEAVLEASAKERLGLETDFMVRTAAEWGEIVDGNPFSREAEREPRRLQAMVLKGPPVQGGVSALREAITGRERVQAERSVAYVFYPDGIGRSRLTTAMIEKHLGTRATGRNWNTVLKLADLVGG